MVKNVPDSCLEGCCDVDGVEEDSGPIVRNITDFKPKLREMKVCCVLVFVVA